MFTIRAHGVPGNTSGEKGDSLSPAQYRLLEDPAPIRVCGAPTGAGKTHAFLQAAKGGKRVVFIVPTQALAGDIEAGAQIQCIPVLRWDGTQNEHLRAQGLQPWIERKLQWDQFKQTGGLLVTTPETLGAILLGRPGKARISLSLADLLCAHHVVFDEAHTLTPRAFGFLHFWAVLILHRHRIDPDGAPKLSLLSATHSNLFEALCNTDHMEDSYIPPDKVACFDETLEEGRREDLRMLHGDVAVETGTGNLLSCIGQYAGEPLAQGQRLLVLYDSLRQLSRDEIALRDRFMVFGLQPEACFLISGQDRKAGGRSLGGSGFEAGLCPEHRHRVIIATSCIEAGVNIADLHYAVLEPGLDAAALLQRIGRVARGNVDGKIWLVAPDRQPAHLLKLQQINGVVNVRDLYRKLAPLRLLPLQQARQLGSAYWSMLKRTQRSVYEGLLQVHGDLSDVKAPGAWLNRLHAQVSAVTRQRDRAKYEQWLKAVDKELTDLRGFSPSVSLQFADYPPVEYSYDWAQAYLEKPDSVDERDGHIVWCFRKPRSACLREKPRQVTVHLLCPNGSVFPGTYHPGLSDFAELKRKYVQYIKEDARGRRDECFLMEAADFVAATGILVREIVDDDSVVS